VTDRADTTTWLAKAPRPSDDSTRSPTATWSTPSPTATTVPASSLPGVKGGGTLIW
jgi:hypothetical protein